MLTKHLFKEWLKGKQPDELVGTIGMPNSCPIATFLRENGASNVYVTTYCRYIVGAELFELNREWISDFVSHIDDLTVLPEETRRVIDESPNDSKVDAATCLKTLEL